MFKDTIRKLPPVRFNSPEPSHLEQLVSDVKLTVHSSEPLQLAEPAHCGCDPYDSRLGQSPDEPWRRTPRRR